MITAKPVAAGGYEPKPVKTDGFGYYRFDFPDEDYRIPGAFYDICEDHIRPGWEAVGDTCHRIELWEQPGLCEPVPDFVNKQTTYTPVFPPIVTPPPPKMMATPPAPTAVPTTAPTALLKAVPVVAPTAVPTAAQQEMHTQKTGCRATHVVRRGEGLFQIGRKFGVAKQQILNANPWVRNQRHWYLYVGQKICIPH